MPIRLRNTAGKLMSVVLDKVYYTPGLCQRSAGDFDRLLSVRQATDGGCSFSFGSHEDTMTASSGDVFRLVRQSGLVWLPAHSAASPAPPASAAPSLPLVTKAIVHRRLCHLHDVGLRKLVSLGVPGVPASCMADPLPFCKCCVMGKSTQADVNRSSTRGSDLDTCFHTMVADIWGPMHTKAIGGYIWVFGAVCFKSAYTLAELMKTKAEAPSVWKRLLLKIRSLGYSVVTLLRVDNDSVLLSKDFMVVCDDFSVVLQRTAPYRHHQLARIECQWRTIAEVVVALLNDYGLATRCWGYAFLAKVYVGLWLRSIGRGVLVLIVFLSNLSCEASSPTCLNYGYLVVLPMSTLTSPLARSLTTNQEKASLLAIAYCFRQPNLACLQALNSLCHPLCQCHF